MCPRALRERASMVTVDAADRVGPSQQNTQEENRQWNEMIFIGDLAIADYERNKLDV